jgi:hypothetical protein
VAAENPELLARSHRRPAPNDWDRFPVLERATRSESPRTGGGVGKTAMDKLNTLAKTYQENNPGMTFAKAFAKVYEANPELAMQERRENRPFGREATS